MSIECPTRLCECCGKEFFDTTRRVYCECGGLIIPTLDQITATRQAPVNMPEPSKRKIRRNISE